MWMDLHGTSYCLFFKETIGIYKEMSEDKKSGCGMQTENIRKMMCIR